MTSIIIGIIGVLLSGFGLWIYIRPLRRINISFIVIDNYSLFRKTTKNFDQIDVKYSQKKIKEDVFLLKACYINRGQKDIVGQQLIKPLIFSIVKPFKILEVKIANKSTDLEVNPILLSKREIQFEWDVLKRSEYFTFDLLIEQTKKEENELRSIPKNSCYSKIRAESSKRRIKHRDYSIFENYGSIKFLLLAIAFLFGGYSFDNYTKKPYDLTHYVEVDSVKYEVSLKINNADSIIVMNNKQDLRYILGNNNELDSLGVRPYFEYSCLDKRFNFINAVLYNIISFLVLIIAIIMTFRIRTLKKIVQDNNNTQHSV